MTRMSQVLAMLLAVVSSVKAQTIATLDVILDKSTAGVAVPVSTNLDAITFMADSTLSLVQVRNNKRTPVHFQIDRAQYHRTLTWIVSAADKNPRFELIAKSAQDEQPARITFDKKDGALILRAGKQNLVSYQFETVMPPEGVDEIFKRSAFIHPLWSPRGHVLTSIQPPDHYHHYGLWNPWTRVLYDGDTVDFWNLYARQGTVRFSDFISTTQGDVFGEYAAMHDHIAFGKDMKESLAIREVQTVRVYAPEKTDYYVADITVMMNCPDKPVRLLEYRYGGFGWRATEQWTNQNSRVITSENKTRAEADGSRARWCIVEGTVDGVNAGVVMMSYPANFNHPEPLRIWPENANEGRGDMFANFSPTKNMDWQLETDKNYVLRYRLIVFDGVFDKEKAEAAWHYFAFPPQVKIVKH